MATNKLANLKSQLLTSGLSGKDQPLFQIINQLIQYLQDANIEIASIASSSGGGGSGSGITSLNTDVVATGPGAAVATIQPNVVSYGKIQQVTALRLVGNSDSVLQDMMEIELGDNLEFLDGVLQITLPDSGGSPGIAHRLLSATHTDTLPAEPIEGDIIYSGAGVVEPATYVYAVIMVPLVIDLPLGIYCALYSGFDGNFLAPTCGAIAPGVESLVVPEVEETWLTWDWIDAYYPVNPTISDPIGLYGMLYSATIPGSGTYTALVPYPFTLAAPPSPLPDSETGLWRRKGIGTTGQVLTVVDGVPEWEDLPPIPAEPAYPWNDIPFFSTDFTATGGVGPTWSVASGDVERWQYQQFPGSGGVGNNVRIALYVRATTVGGTAPTQLQIALPFSIIGRFAEFISIQENGAAANGVFVEYDDGVSSTSLTLNKIGGAAFDTTAGGTFLAFEISAVLAP